jgi:hypothetical protein
MLIVLGVVVAVTTAGLGAWVLLDHSGKFLWFYWLAPLLALGAGLTLLMLAVQYWAKVGRLEVKGRPRSE